MRDVVELVEGEPIEEDDVSGRSRWLIALLGLMLRRPQDTLAAAVAAAALLSVMVNALFLQPNPHPAPLFSVQPKPPAAVRSEPTGAIRALPRPRPIDHVAPHVEPAAKPVPTPRSRADIVTDIQRELSRRGFYNGAIDGIHGSRTAAAIRELEQAAGVRVGAEPSEPMLQAILRAPSTAQAGLPRRGDPIGDLVARMAPRGGASSSEPVAAAAPMPASPAASERNAAEATPVSSDASATHSNLAALSPQPAAHPTPRADLPSPEVKSLQRALSQYGYGQITPTGIVDAPTAAAIRDFEQMRSLPITGQMSERIVQELAKVTETPIE